MKILINILESYKIKYEVMEFTLFYYQELFNMIFTETKYSKFRFYMVLRFGYISSRIYTAFNYNKLIENQLL